MPIIEPPAGPSPSPNDATYTTGFSWWTFSNQVTAATALVLGGLLLAPKFHIALAASAAGLLYAGFVWVKKRSFKIILTSRHLNASVKFFSLHSATVNLDRIESVDVDQTLIQRIIDIGDVSIHGTGGEDVQLNGIRAPKELKRQILVAKDITES